MKRKSRPPKREYYSISEVCALVGLKPHVLRYWETQFEELAPPKNRSGNRVYRARDVELIALIHRLVHEERYTLEGARRKLQELRVAGSDRADAEQALERVYLRTLRAELEEVLQLLSPDVR